MSAAEQWDFTVPENDEELLPSFTVTGCGQVGVSMSRLSQTSWVPRETRQAPRRLAAAGV